MNIPADFNPIGYDIRTTDGTLWTIHETEDHYELRSDSGVVMLMKLSGIFTFFLPGYKNINIYGFSCGNRDFELEEAVMNVNYVSAPVIVPVVPDILESRELAFVQDLLYFAQEFGIDLTQINDVTISTLLEVATSLGISSTDISRASSRLLIRTRDIEVAAGDISWAQCWHGLKQRLPGYIRTLLDNQQASL